MDDDPLRLHPAEQLAVSSGYDIISTGQQLSSVKWRYRALNFTAAIASSICSSKLIGRNSRAVSTMIARYPKRGVSMIATDGRYSTLADTPLGEAPNGNCENVSSPRSAPYTEEAVSVAVGAVTVSV